MSLCPRRAKRTLRGRLHWQPPFMTTSNSLPRPSILVGVPSVLPLGGLLTRFETTSSNIIRSLQAGQIYPKQTGTRIVTASVPFRNGWTWPSLRQCRNPLDAGEGITDLDLGSNGTLRATPP